jgi:hypothetical protein
MKTKTNMMTMMTALIGGDYDHMSARQSRDSLKVRG